MTTVIDNVNNKNQLNFYSSGSETLSYTLVSKNNENLLVLHDVKFVFSSHSLERLVKDVGSCDIRLEGDAVIVSGILSVSLRVYDRKECEVLSSASVLEDAPQRCGSVITVHYPAAGERLFDIAKKYRTTSSKIALGNSIDISVSTSEHSLPKKLLIL
jgi:hypothetical protein